jgi:hypothetical protein
MHMFFKARGGSSELLRAFFFGHIAVASDVEPA